MLDFVWWVILVCTFPAHGGGLAKRSPALFGTTLTCCHLVDTSSLTELMQYFLTFIPSLPLQHPRVVICYLVFPADLHPLRLRIKQRGWLCLPWAVVSSLDFRSCACVHACLYVYGAKGVFTGLFIRMAYYKFECFALRSYISTFLKKNLLICGK